jgi:hypothetical protein
MKATTTTRLFINCPACSAVCGAVDHLFKMAPTTWGPWHCDECHAGFRGKAHPDGTLDVELTGERMVPQFVMVEIPPQTETISLMLETTYLERFTDESVRYLIEEHSCPSNHLRAVGGVWLGDDADPHGLMRFVARYQPKPEETHVRDMQLSDALQELAPLAR